MRLPPLNGLRAFEAAARLGSFNEAAEELNVTPAAISHQIKGLEAYLDRPLFHRVGRGVTLTDAARDLLPEITRGFAHFGRAIGGLEAGRIAGRLIVSAIPSFAELWLTPRLKRFITAYPQIELQIRASHIPPNLEQGEVHLRIAYGLGNYPGLVTRPLMQDTIFPVCAPSLLNQTPLRDFRDLAKHVLLQDSQIDRAEPTMQWTRWLRDAGVVETSPLGLVEFEGSALLTEAAVHGLGVGLGRISLVRDHLRTGRLVRPFKIERPADYAYFTITTETAAERPRIKAFFTWLDEEIRRDSQTQPD